MAQFSTRAKQGKIIYSRKFVPLRAGIAEPISISARFAASFTALASSGVNLAAIKTSLAFDAASLGLAIRDCKERRFAA